LAPQRRRRPAACTKVSALGLEEQRVNAVLDILSPREQWSALGGGYKADVRIVVQTVGDELKVPASALFPSGTRAALYTVEGGPRPPARDGGADAQRQRGLDQERTRPRRRRRSVPAHLAARG